MPSNVEIKARAENPGLLRKIAADLADKPCETVPQEDVFFRVDTGRLKLRILPDGTGQLIEYSRPDTTEAKRSDYQIYRTADPRGLREVLSKALGEIVTVKKVRDIYIVGQTRVHVDEVEGLGSYMELEVVLDPGQSAEEGRLIADDLMRKLGVRETDLVSCAYADLLMGLDR